jgi:uncharacterized protein
MNKMADLPQPLEFNWDEANKNKIWSKHKISTKEIEEAFATEYIFSQPDELHSGAEDRYLIASQTQKGKILFIVYTLRNNQVRVISARGMHKKELSFYEKEARSAKIQE